MHITVNHLHREIYFFKLSGVDSNQHFHGSQPKKKKALSTALDSKQGPIEHQSKKWTKWPNTGSRVTTFQQMFGPPTQKSVMHKKTLDNLSLREQVTLQRWPTAHFSLCLTWSLSFEELTQRMKLFKKNLHNSRDRLGSSRHNYTQSPLFPHPNPLTWEHWKVIYWPLSQTRQWKERNPGHSIQIPVRPLITILWNMIGYEGKRPILISDVHQGDRSLLPVLLAHGRNDQWGVSFLSSPN